ncbi:cytidylate kinase [Hesseltinella vesiculosa]|uniref:(d)CMP kinase n=1 Tax=Hesseltinella vesiculosa TaxID=101127 RepID=A0A1X2G4U5_9FUNG|nr:cytidylate kinase [Hesseltinella vesiculosa]
MTRLFRIAIDGPAASGKSTTAKQLARLLGFRYIDSGAMYRSVTLKCMTMHLDPLVQRDEVAKVAQSLDIQFPDLGLVSNDGKDVTKLLRQESITRSIAPIASNPLVRQAMADKQRLMAQTLDDRYAGYLYRGRCTQGVIMDGRDIGTVILPDAELKIFLVADLKARAERRFKELKGHDGLEQIMKDIEARDLADRTRTVGPLKKASDAVELDNSHLSLDQQVQQIQQWVHQRLDLMQASP